VEAGSWIHTYVCDGSRWVKASELYPLGFRKAEVQSQVLAALLPSVDSGEEAVLGSQSWLSEASAILSFSWLVSTSLSSCLFFTWPSSQSVSVCPLRTAEGYTDQYNLALTNHVCKGCISKIRLHPEFASGHELGGWGAVCHTTGRLRPSPGGGPSPG
jgi:hypothetical protein